MDWGSDSQTVHVHVPKIGTTASVGGAKEAVLGGKITVEDVVAYENLTPGVEYVLYGWLVNKGTGERFKADGKNVLSERTFKPKQSEGTVQMSFTFDSSGISETTDLVVYEQLTREGVEISVHENLEDADQTVTLTKGTPSAAPKPEAPDTPETGDRSGLRLCQVPWRGSGPGSGRPFDRRSLKSHQRTAGMPSFLHTRR